MNNRKEKTFHLNAKRKKKQNKTFVAFPLLCVFLFPQNSFYFYDHLFTKCLEAQFQWFSKKKKQQFPSIKNNTKYRSKVFVILCKICSINRVLFRVRRFNISLKSDIVVIVVIGLFHFSPFFKFNQRI